MKTRNLIVLLYLLASIAVAVVMVGHPMNYYWSPGFWSPDPLPANLVPTVHHTVPLVAFTMVASMVGLIFLLAFVYEPPQREVVSKR